MKPQKKAAVARKAASTPTVAKKRRTFPENLSVSLKREKKSKKQEKLEDPKRKMDSEKKKLEKLEEKKKLEEKRKLEKLEEKRKVEEKKKERLEERMKEEKVEKADEKKKQCKEQEKKSEKTDEKRNADKVDKKDQEEESNVNDGVEKKPLKAEEKCRYDKQYLDGKKKNDKIEEKKRLGKPEEEERMEDLVKSVEEKDMNEDKIDFMETVMKKRNSKEEKKKETKLMKSELKDHFRNTCIMTKERKLEQKKVLEKEIGRKTSPTRAKKDSKGQQKKTTPKKTVLANKMASHSPVSKKLIEKKIKLVKKLKKEETLANENDKIKKAKKKSSVPKSKTAQDKKPKLVKQMKAKLSQKLVKLSSTLKKEEKIRKLTEKIGIKKKVEPKDLEKVSGEHTKITNKDEALDEVVENDIKKEIDEDKEEEKRKEDSTRMKSLDTKRAQKNISKTKANKKIIKKSTKSTKVATDDIDQKSTSSDDVTLEELLKQSKMGEDSVKTTANSKQEQGESSLKMDLKVETIDGSSIESSLSSSLDSEDEDRDESSKKSKRRFLRKKERKNSSSDERARRMRLFGFWSGPKRHRVASLNALAKVHCLYENESGGVYLGGFCKPKSDKEKQKKNKEESKDRESDGRQIENRTEDNTSRRKLRNVPGLRGKHWDMMESSSSSSSSSDDDYERERNTEWRKKKTAKKRKKSEEVMDLKDMVVCKRMASLNASAILAASYSDEKNQRGSSCSDSSSESEVEIIKRRKQSDSDADKQKSRHSSDPEEVIKPSKKVVIVNQDTDVTITGVYVNQTRSTHHEGFCSIAGMQYRISSTSHTQTAATAVATELHEQQKPEQPCKSYTPLGALSSMQPPGSQGNHSPLSPRRHSAFSAPHQHGYYQPAGPLIQHPPTLPPVKGPPPEPTPTPPQNSEGSDDLVATSTTSGGTNSTDNSRLLNGGGGFYRTYCPQYYGTPPQYQELCYPPTYSHPHSHPPPYYKYAPTYRRQYYGYQETGGPGSGGPGGGGPGVVEYQPPPPPAEYPPPPYYGGYPPPPPPPPPPPNPAYLHAQGRPFVDHAAFQGCPCPMQSCPKNVDTGPLIGNGKGAPVVSGPGLSLPPSALVGPPSPARGLAGLAPPHGANAWDTDRVQINTHRNLNQNQPPLSPSRNLAGGRNHSQNSEYRTKDEKNLQGDKLKKCSCQKHACTSTCEVKMENLSPTEKLSVTSCPTDKLHNLKLENNNVKCESCSVEMSEKLCAANCNVKCESDYKCEMLKCEQCVKEGQMAILDIDKDSGILLIDDKLEGEGGVKEELNDVVLIENDNWKKADYEPTVQETVEDKEVIDERTNNSAGHLKCQKVTKRKLSLDSLSDNRKKRKVNKRTLSVGSARDLINDLNSRLVFPAGTFAKTVDSIADGGASKKKQPKKNVQSQKRKADNPSPCEILAKKCKVSKPCGGITNCLKHNASETSIMETINNVIQQGLQMTRKKDRKLKKTEQLEKKRKKKSANLLSTIKKVSKKMDLVKMAVSEKLGISKAEVKCNQSKNKSDVKTKLKTQDAKSKSKPKAKILEVKAKVLDVKSKAQDSKSKDVSKKSESVPKAKVSEVSEDIKKLSLVKKRRKSTKKMSKKTSSKSEDTSVAEENLNLLRKPFLKPKWSNGWSFEGEAYEAKVYLTNEESAIRRCYESMKHVSGDVLRPRDCVLLKSGPRKADLPFVAKIAALWENPDDGEMMFSLLWYYRPEHTEQGRTEYDTEDEVFASRHRDANSVACIEDKCYILTFNEYCRYRKNLRRMEEGLESPGLIVPPGDQVYPRENRQPPIPVPSDMVLFCRRVYDYRGKKLVKNPG